MQFKVGDKVRSTYYDWTRDLTGTVVDGGNAVAGMVLVDFGDAAGGQGHDGWGYDELRERDTSKTSYWYLWLEYLKPVAQDAKFKVGDKVRVVEALGDEEFNGREGTVSRITESGARLSFDEPVYAKGTEHDLRYGDDFGWNFLDVDTLELVKPAAPTIASDLSLTPQAKTVLRHLRKHGRITPMKALVVYGISRLASCIHEIRKIGYDVITDVHRDEGGHRFANYKLTVQ